MLLVVVDREQGFNAQWSQRRIAQEVFGRGKLIFQMTLKVFDQMDLRGVGRGVVDQRRVDWLHELRRQQLLLLLLLLLKLKWTAHERRIVFLLWNQKLRLLLMLLLVLLLVGRSKAPRVKRSGR